MPKCPDCGMMTSNLASHQRNYCLGDSGEEDDSDA